MNWNLMENKYWTYESEKQMLDYLRDHRYMWDPQHVLFHRRPLRQDAFVELSNLLGIDIPTIRQRWNSMRNQFGREQKRVDADRTYIPRWCHYQSMLFMRERSGPKSENLTDIGVGEQVVNEGEEDDYSKIKIVVMNNEENTHRELESFDQPPNHDTKEGDTEMPPEIIPSLENHSSSRRKRNFVTNKRLHPIYGKRVHISSPQIVKKTVQSVPTSPPSPPAPAPSKDGSSSGRLSENESFTQYMSSVLERFDEEKQRKCRSELLRIILKYDIGE